MFKICSLGWKPGLISYYHDVILFNKQSYILKKYSLPNTRKLAERDSPLNGSCYCRVAFVRWDQKLFVYKKKKKMWINTFHLVITYLYCFNGSHYNIHTYLGIHRYHHPQNLSLCVLTTTMKVTCFRQNCIVSPKKAANTSASQIILTITHLSMSISVIRIIVLANQFLWDLLGSTWSNKRLLSTMMVSSLATIY